MEHVECAELEVGEGGNLKDQPTNWLCIKFYITSGFIVNDTRKSPMFTILEMVIPNLSLTSHPDGLPGMQDK